MLGQLVRKRMTQGKDEVLACKKANISDTNAAAAGRFRWLLNGNGYFLEEGMLCGHDPDEDEKRMARFLIDIEMERK